MKVRKKPIFVDAEEATEDGSIQTLEGVMTYKKGDYIITGVNGEHYPVKADIFPKLYEEEGTKTLNEQIDEVLDNMNKHEWAAEGVVTIKEVDLQSGGRCKIEVILTRYYPNGNGRRQ